MDLKRINILNLLQGGEELVKIRCLFFAPNEVDNIPEEIKIHIEELFKFPPNNGDYDIKNGYAEGYVFIGVFDESADAVIINREPFIILQEDGSYKAYNANKSSEIHNPYILTQTDKNTLIKELYC